MTGKAESVFRVSSTPPGTGVPIQHISCENVTRDGRDRKAVVT